jgi:hypothetical protein
MVGLPDVGNEDIDMLHEARLYLAGMCMKVEKKRTREWRTAP